MHRILTLFFLPMVAKAWLAPLAHGVDRLIGATGLPPQVVTATLMKLQMRNPGRALPGFRYVKR